jgi:hypothetical protein
MKTIEFINISRESQNIILRPTKEDDSMAISKWLNR